MGSVSMKKHPSTQESSREPRVPEESDITGHSELLCIEEIKHPEEQSKTHFAPARLPSCPADFSSK